PLDGRHATTPRTLEPFLRGRTYGLVADHGLAVIAERRVTLAQSVENPRPPEAEAGDPFGIGMAERDGFVEVAACRDELPIREREKPRDEVIDGLLRVARDREVEVAPRCLAVVVVEAG